MEKDDEILMHKYGDHQLHDSALSIPSSLPPKMKELLTELAMVEKEINRLEMQINAIQAEEKPEKQGKSNEIKGFHFITKAIRGDYQLTDFSFNENQKVSKRSGVVKLHLSPSRQRHQTPGRNYEEEKTPNKLSENIIKCLISIFMRLLRSTTNFSLRFRGETNSKSGFIFQKNEHDYCEQDPYGIFDWKESIRRDIGPYKNLVRFTSSSMDFNCFQNSGFVPLFQKLKILMDGLQKVELRFLNHQQKLAFWINIYNACIMHGYLQYGLPSVFTPEKMLTLINQATLNIAGHSMNAQTIKCFILRKPSYSSLDKQIHSTKEMITHQLYGLKTPDPNIIFALSCGTRSSPAVRIYTAEGVTAELERSKVEYLQAAIMVTTTKRIAIPELLLRNMHDFGQDMGSLMEWLCHQSPPLGTLRKSIAGCFRGLHGGKVGPAVGEMIPYDFQFQYLFAIS